MTVRIVETYPVRSIGDYLIRGYLLDQRLHFYLKAELANPAFEFLVPMCGEDPMYPQRHPRVEVPRQFIRTNGFCVPCAVAYEDSEEHRGERHARHAL